MRQIAPFLFVLFFVFWFLLFQLGFYECRGLLHAQRFISFQIYRELLFTIDRFRDPSLFLSNDWCSNFSETFSSTNWFRIYPRTFSSTDPRTLSLYRKIGVLIFLKPSHRQIGFVFTQEPSHRQSPRTLYRYGKIGLFFNIFF